MTSRRRASSSHPRVSSLDTNFEWPRCLSSDGYGGLFWFRGGDHKETTTVFRFHRIAKGLLHHDNSDGRTQSPVGLVGGLFPVRGTSSVITGSFIYRLLHTSLARHLYKAFVYHLVGYIYLSLFPPPFLSHPRNAVYNSLYRPFTSYPSSIRHWIDLDHYLPFFYLAFSSWILLRAAIIATLTIVRFSPMYII